MSNEAPHVVAKIRAYILENLLFSSNEADLVNDVSLLDLGIIDSTSVLEITLFMEETFDVQVKPSDMLPENFGSVDNMVRFVSRLLGAR